MIHCGKAVTIVTPTLSFNTCIVLWCNPEDDVEVAQHRLKGLGNDRRPDHCVVVLAPWQTGTVLGALRSADFQLDETRRLTYFGVRPPKGDEQ